MAIVAEEKAQYVTNRKGKRVGVLLDLRTFERIKDDLDDYYCRRAYDKAKPLTDAQINRGEFVTIEELTTRRKVRKSRPGRKHK